MGVDHGEWGFKTFSKLKPVVYRSKFNRLTDLYPPYGGKIARLEWLMRFMSQGAVVRGREANPEPRDPVRAMRALE
ncbi:hypothetical protein HAP40_05615 [Bradyrhizobium sp. 1(2017)]|nr:hypothetical protein [Bradyrhizobium sp. 1(2017)]QIO30298.1 hypothetical protein HAP40_05615 [Bradyrhizobium sp. 1(2017)]